MAETEGCLKLIVLESDFSSGPDAFFKFKYNGNDFKTDIQAGSEEGGNNCVGRSELSNGFEQ